MMQVHAGKTRMRLSDTNATILYARVMRHLGSTGKSVKVASQEMGISDSILHNLSAFNRITKVMAAKVESWLEQNATVAA